MDFPTLVSLFTSETSPSPNARPRGNGRLRPSIFSRLAYGSLAIVIVMGGVNLYALFQLRELTSMSTGLVTYHYPAIEGAKRLLSSLYAQLRSEKKYMAVLDPEFVTYFREESDEFSRTLTRLMTAETSESGSRLLTEVQDLQAEYRRRFIEAAGSDEGFAAGTPEQLQARREALVEKITTRLQSYIAFHEAKVSTGVTESQASSTQAEAVTRQLIVLALLVALGFAGVVSYSILRPLRRLQTHIQMIGRGKFGTTVDVEAPSDLAELVETVNWMARKLQELDDMKSEFIAHVSHELRSPLASIQEGTQLLLDQIPGPLTREQREALLIMAESSRRLIHMISTLLDLSKIEAGMMEYRFVLTDLKKVADASVSKIRLFGEAKHVHILTEAPAGQLLLPVDPARVEQVLDNLLSNAVKFSPPGGVVHLRLFPEPETEAVRITVSDAGPGITPEDLPRLFERFYQGRGHASSALASSGLGLSLAKKVVEAHGGRIWVESEPGKGTTMYVVLEASPKK